MKDKSELKGIGGWLILVAIGVFIGPFYAVIIDFITYAPYFEDGDFWGVLSYLNSTIPNFSLLFWPETLFAIIFDFFLFYLVYLLIKKKAFFPVLYVRLIYIQIIYLIVDYGAVYLLFGEEYFDIGPLEARAIFQSLITLVIWVPYMYKSVRVKNTFVN
jgi:hypothetical protein